MSNHPPEKSPNVALILSIALATWLILIPLVNQIQLPFGENKIGVISLASLENISPYTDYIKYLLLVLTPPLVAGVILNLNSNLLTQKLNKTLQLFHHSRFLISITSLLLTTWLINVAFTQFPIGDILIDSFHEGEFLGFLPDFVYLKKPFIETVLIHGFGIDVLPSLLAKPLAIFNNGIAMTRLFVNLQNVIACLGCFYILWEITQLAKLEKHHLKIFLLACVLFCIGDDIFFRFDLRRGVWFIGQFALTLRWLRLSPNFLAQSRILPILIGASIPTSLLYVYDRGIYFLPVYFCTSIISLTLDHRLAKNWWRGTVAGGVGALGLMISIMGFNQVIGIISQILYWGKYGRYITFIPLPELGLTWLSQRFWLSIFMQGAVIVYLVLDLQIKQFNLRLFFRKNVITLVLFSASFAYMRITLDRSDFAHAFDGAFPAAWLAYYLLLRGYQKYLEPKFKQISITPISQLTVGLLLIYLVLSDPDFNGVNAMIQLKLNTQAIFTPDRELLKPDYVEAWETMTPRIEQQSCFFTLTSEGLWYYLFDQPSCSRFSYVLYAASEEAQSLVIEDLEVKQPALLLFTNELWYKNRWDGVLKADSAAKIYQYVLTEYQPDQVIESHWFWRRRLSPIQLNNQEKMTGVIDFIPPSPIRRGEEVSISGWSIIAEKNKPVDAVFLSYGSENQLINASLINIPRPDVSLAFSDDNYQQSGWQVIIPTGILPLGKNRLKVWGYDQEQDELRMIDSEVEITIVEASYLKSE